MKRGPNARALARTLAELRRMGRLEPVDEARIQALRTMAQTLDARSSNANLWKIYHLVLERLIADDASDTDLDRAWAELSADVGDSPTS